MVFRLLPSSVDIGLMEIFRNKAFFNGPSSSRSRTVAETDPYSAGKTSLEATLVQKFRPTGQHTEPTKLGGVLPQGRKLFLVTSKAKKQIYFLFLVQTYV